METNTLLLWVVVILAFVALGGFLMYRRRTRTEIKGPFGTGMTIDASNDAPPAQTPPGVTLEGVKAGKNVETTVGTGGGAALKDVTAETGSVKTTVNAPPDPKAQPPA